MREIEFRGLRTDGKGWIYGGYKNTGGIVFIICRQGNTLDHSHEVIPESVGQYTGLKDKNGTKIFEGDIFNCETHNITIEDNKKVTGSEHIQTYLVEWSTKDFVNGWQFRVIETSKKNKFGIGKICNTSLYVYLKNSEVIGNIHESK